MRFSLIYLTMLVTAALASPAPAPMAVAGPVPAPNAAMCARNVAETDLIADAIVFGVESAKCRILHLPCARVVASIFCIAGALPDVTATLACVGGNHKTVSRLLIGTVDCVTNDVPSCATVRGVFPT
jgi:hypothetical protein